MRKLNNKQLALILVILVAVFGITRYVKNKKGENTFRTSIIPKIDSAKITGILLYPKIKGSKLIRFTHTGKQWFVSQGDITSRTEPKSVGYVIQLLQQVSPDRLATNDPEHWKEFDVTDTTGTRVVLLNDKDTIVDVIVGRFSYLPAERKGMTYIRIRGQKEVYGVEGFLAMNITEDFNSWRDKRLVPGDKTTWTQLTFTYPDSGMDENGHIVTMGYVVNKDSTGWIVDGKKPDSLATATLLNTLSQQNYGSFIDKFDTNKRQPIFTLQIWSSVSGTALLKAYPTDSVGKYVITSSINPGAYMNGNAGGLFQHIFISKEVFFHHAETPKQTANKPKRVGKI